MRRKRLLILLTEYYYFESHKQDLAVAAAEEGFEVFVAARRGPSQISPNAPFTFIDISWKRSSSLLASALRFLPELGRIRGLLADVRPDALHNIALKPSIMGSLAAVGQPIAVINSINGLGFVFYARSVFARVVQGFCGWVLRRSVRCNDARIVLQNADDAAYMRDRLQIGGNSIQLVRGSGVDLARFAPLPEPPSLPVRFLVIGRLLFMKGVDVAIAANQMLRARGVAAELVFAGGRDENNPSSIPQATIDEWAARPGVSFLGYIGDTRAALSGAHVVIQATTAGEGLPKSLLEAAASNRALIATDVPGNREIVVHEKTGLLVPPGDVQALSDAMARLAADTDLRHRLAETARAKVTQEFGAELIHAQHRQLYRTVSAR